MNLLWGFSFDDADYGIEFFISILTETRLYGQLS